MHQDKSDEQLMTEYQEISRVLVGVGMASAPTPGVFIAACVDAIASVAHQIGNGVQVAQLLRDSAEMIESDSAYESTPA